MSNSSIRSRGVACPPANHGQRKYLWTAFALAILGLIAGGLSINRSIDSEAAGTSHLSSDSVSPPEAAPVDQSAHLASMPANTPGSSRRSPDSFTRGRPEDGGTLTASKRENPDRPDLVTREGGSARRMGRDSLRNPDERFGKREGIGSSMLRVTYSLDDYAKAYPDAPNLDGLELQMKQNYAKEIVEVHGNRGEPIARLDDVLVSCPSEVLKSSTGVVFKLGTAGQIIETGPVLGTLPAPPSVNQCRFRPFLLNGNPIEVTTSIPPAESVQWKTSGAPGGI